MSTRGTLQRASRGAVRFVRGRRGLLQIAHERAIGLMPVGVINDTQQRGWMDGDECRRAVQQG